MVELRGALTSGALLLASMCGGCTALSPAHMFGLQDADHPWHQLPGKVAFVVTAFPMLVLTSPIWITENLLGLSSATKKSTVGVSTVLVAGVSYTCGYLVAAPPFVLGLPFESTTGEAAPAEQDPAGSGSR